MSDLDKSQRKVKVILYVEEDMASRFLLKQILRQENYDIIEAKDGIDGVKKAKEFKPDLIFMELMTPELDGFGAMKQIRDFDPEVPIVVVTALSSKRWECMSQGFSDFLEKPLDPNRFPGQVKKYLDQKRG